MRYWWIFFVSTVLVSVVGGGIWYYYRDFPIFSDGQAINNYPTVSWQSVVDGSVARSLARQGRAGKVSGFEDSVAPATSFARMTTEYKENEGVDLVELPSEIVRSQLYQEVTKRPFATVAFYQTMIGEEKYYLLYQRWRSMDGSESYLPILIPSVKGVGGRSVRVG